MNRATFIAAVLLVAILGALGGWYILLRSRTSAIEQADAARGFGIPTPSSAGEALGGTASNLAYAPGLGAISGGGSASGQGQSQTGRQDWTATSTLGSEASWASASTTGAAFRVRLLKPGKTPIAGFGFVSKDGTTRLLWVDRATGYVFSTDLGSGETARLTNTLRPKVYEAIFDAQGVIERSIADDGSIDTFLGTFHSDATSTAGTLAGARIESGVAAIAAVPSAQSGLFYIRTAKNGDTEVVLAKRDGAKGTAIFSSSLRGWRPYALADGRFIVAQLPATGVAGFAYEVGKASSPTPIVANAPGLIVLPRAWSSALLWSSSGSAGTTLFARANADAEVARLSLATPADKCAWAVPAGASAKKPGALIAYCAVPKDAPGGGFLENWYQGVSHSQDRWWKVDASSGSIQPLYAGSEQFDVRDPAVDPSGRYVAFINAADDSLWLMQVAQ